MNDDDPYGLSDFDRPTEALLSRLTSAASRPGRVPLSIIDFRPAGQSDGLAGAGELTLDVNGAIQQYTLAAQGRIRSRAELAALAAKNRTAAFPVLLATAYLTLALADECVEHDLQFIDLAGNLYMHAPGQYMLVTGQAGESRDQASGIEIREARHVRERLCAQDDFCIVIGSRVA